MEKKKKIRKKMKHDANEREMVEKPQCTCVLRVGQAAAIFSPQSSKGTHWIPPRSWLILASTTTPLGASFGSMPWQLETVNKRGAGGETVNLGEMCAAERPVMQGRQCLLLSSARHQAQAKR